MKNLIIFIHIWALPYLCDATTTYYLASGGPFGNGSSINEPLDASTRQKLDAIMAGLRKSHPSDVLLQFLGGNFVSSQIWMGSQWKARGLGKDQTFIKFVNPNGGILFRYINHSDYGQSVEDMTIDCNYRENIAPHLSEHHFSGAVGAIFLCGTGTFAKNVRIKHSGGGAGPGATIGEVFAVIFYGFTDNPPNNQYADGVEVLSPASKVTAIAIANPGNYGSYGLNVAQQRVPPVWATGACITNCLVENAGIGGGIGGQDGAKIYNNTFTNCKYGVYLDTFPSRNQQVFNNRIQHCIDGINFQTEAGKGAENTQVYSNTISVNSQGIVFGFRSSGTVIRNNTIRRTSGKVPSWWPQNGISIVAPKGCSASNVTIKGNVMDPLLPSVITASGSVLIRGNYNFDGSSHARIRLNHLE